MKSNGKRNLLIIELAALLVLAFCFTRQDAWAQRDDDDVVLLYSSLPGGLVRGETLRVIIANQNEGDPAKRVLEPEIVRVRLFAADGRVIAQSEAVAVGAGELQIFDFDRASLSLAGEAGTGRVQARIAAEVQCNLVKKVDAFEFKQEIRERFPASSELIENSTGGTRVHSDLTFVDIQ